MPSGVLAGWTTRQSGYSRGDFAQHNIARHVGDNVQCVESNRRLMQQRLQGQPTPVWLNQTHSTEVIDVRDANLNKPQDGSYTQQVNIACCVMTADCLPVFMWRQNGEQVAAVHAGWRGLADGILLNALSQFEHPSQVICGIGPAISQPNFEVGHDVVTAFNTFPNYADCFQPADQRGKYLCDLPALAENQLRQAGVGQVYLSGICTFAQAKRFYSYRRDGQTGRMANLIWKLN